MMPRRATPAVEFVTARSGACGVITLLAILAVICAWPSAPIAAQSEARPWLCRDKPAFSSSGPVSFKLACNGKRRWMVSFMLLEPGGSHDGFSVVATRELGPSTPALQGSLSDRRFFVVAQFLSSGHWICARWARENRAVGAVENLSYGDDAGSSCRLRVTRQAAARQGSPAR